jgi:hypothetical protein
MFRLLIKRNKINYILKSKFKHNSAIFAFPNRAASMNPKRELIYSKFSLANGLGTLTLIYKKHMKRQDNFYELPFWIFFIICLFLGLLLVILISAICLSLLSQKPGLYNEHCKQRSCAPGLGLKCIDATCKCPSDQYYLKSCNNKKSLNKFCQSSSQCLNNMVCIFGKCQCSEKEYWSVNKCIRRKSNREPCNGGDCSKSVMLYCNTNSAVCLCPSDR